MKYKSVLIAFALVIIGLVSGGLFFYKPEHTKPVHSTFSGVLPPDPGEVGKQTLEGVDLDKDGVRDDVQRLIILNNPESEAIRRALMDAAKSLQNSMVTSFGSAEDARFGMWLSYVASLKSRVPSDLYTPILKQQLNTRARFEAFSNRSMSPLVYDPPKDLSQTCSFDPKVMD